MMPRPDRDRELIELLPADDAPHEWSRPDAATPPAPSRGRRSVVVGSLAGIVAVAVVAVVVASTDQVATPPSTTMPGIPTTAPPLLVPDEPVADGLFVLAAADLRPYAADITSPPDEREAFWLWASVTSTAVPNP